MPETQFDASKYWKDRLNRNFDLTGVGFRRRSSAFNRRVYQVRTEALDELFRTQSWPIDGQAVLDIGCGTGYFVAHWTDRGAGPIMGLDLAEVSIERLRKQFADANFRCADLTDPELKIDGTFDYISIFDVLYHVVDDRRFEQAVENLSKLCKAGSKVIITDMFGRRTAEFAKHVRNRSQDHYAEVFRKKGFKLSHLEPLFFTLMPPARLANPISYWAGTLAWEGITGLARWDTPGRLIGSALYSVDTFLRRRFRRGPSHHLAVFEFEGR